MRKFLFLFIIIYFISCCSIKKDVHIAIYKWKGFGELPSEYIILKGSNKICEFLPSYEGGIGTLGKYSIKNDTLYFNIRYVYNSNFIYTADSMSVYPRKFLINKNTLIDVTDYTSIDSLFIGYNMKHIYKRIK